MAVVHYKRLNAATLSGRYGESFQIVEKWRIKTDSPTTSKVAIAGAVPGAYFGADHPEIPSCKAMEFDVAPANNSGVSWILTVRYYVPSRPRLVESGMPAPIWRRRGGVTSVPTFRDASGTMITNAANDPVEGLQRERSDTGWVLRKCYANDAALEADIVAYSGRTNSATWASYAAHCWKCDFMDADPKEISKFEGTTDGGTLKYVEALWEFRLDTQTWKCMPWNVGFMELVSGTKKVILADGKPVKQPVALTNSGAKAADGTVPSVINSGAGAILYPTANFTTGFGTPVMVS